MKTSLLAALAAVVMAALAAGCGGSSHHGGGGSFVQASPSPSPSPTPSAISMPPSSAQGNGQAGAGAGLVSGTYTFDQAPTLLFPLLVTVVDQNNNPVSGAVVTFTLSQPATGAGGFSNYSLIAAVPPSTTHTPDTSKPGYSASITSTTATETTNSAGQAGIYLIPGVGATTGANTITVTATFNGLTAASLQFTETGS